MSDGPVAPPALAPEKTGIVEDFIDILFAPARVFARRAAASPALPFLIVCVLLIALFFTARGALQPIIDAEMQKALDAAMKSNPQLTPEMLAQSRGMTDKFAVVGAVVVVPVSILVLALATFGVGRALGGSLSYGAAVTIATFASVPRIFDYAGVDVQGLVGDTSAMTSRYQLTLGVGRFFDPATTSPLLLAMIGRVDLFTLWVTVLLAIGLVAAGKVPRTRMILAGALMWLVGAIPGVWQALRS